MANWFYFDGEKKQCGPVSASVIQNLVKQGVLAPGSPVVSDDGKTSTTADKISEAAPVSPFGCGCLVILVLLLCLAFRPSCRSEPPNGETPVQPAVQPEPEYTVTKDGTDLTDWQIEVKLNVRMGESRIREVADAVTSEYLHRSSLATVIFCYRNEVLAIAKYENGEFNSIEFSAEKQQRDGESLKSDGDGRKNEAREASLPAALIAKYENAPYTIISDTDLGNIKRSVEVRLESHLTEDQIKSIAQEVQRKKSKKYERTFIEYYLPGMQPGQGAWAVSHFTPNLEIRILGATKNTIDSVRDKLAKDEAETIGAWEFLAQSVITIKKQDDKEVIGIVFSDGSGGDYPLTKTTHEGKTIYKTSKPFPLGETTFRISQGGNLIVFDEDGDFASYPRLE